LRALAVLLLCGGVVTPPQDVSGKSLAIVAAEKTEEAARQHLAKARSPSAFVLRTDDYQGLKPGLHVVVDSVHEGAAQASARCAELQKQGVDCYVRQAGARKGAAESSLAREKQVATARGGAGATADFAGRIEVRGRSIPVVVVSRPLPAPKHRYTPTKKDHATAVFLFVGNDPVEIADHDFLKPGARIWEDVECGPLKLLPLGQSGTPVALAQRCNEQGDTQQRFLVFDEGNLEHPAKGNATWSPSVYPDATHERFAPNDDAAAAGGISPKRGDGKTVVEGVEGKKAGPSPDAFLVRDFAVEWQDGKLVRRAGEWRTPEQQ